VPKYILTYHQPKGYAPGRDPAVMTAWEAFFTTIADRVVDPGQPVFELTSVGEVGAGTQLGGYSLVAADSLDEAAALANACPTLQHGGGVAVGELAELPPDHIAARLRERLAQA
jgi:hypothetical protein